MRCSCLRFCPALIQFIFQIWFLSETQGGLYSSFISCHRSRGYLVPNLIYRSGYSRAWFTSSWGIWVRHLRGNWFLQVGMSGLGFGLRFRLPNIVLAKCNGILGKSIVNDFTHITVWCTLEENHTHGWHICDIWNLYSPLIIFYSEMLSLLAERQSRLHK